MRTTNVATPYVPCDRFVAGLLSPSNKYGERWRGRKSIGSDSDTGDDSDPQISGSVDQQPAEDAAFHTRKDLLPNVRPPSMAVSPEKALNNSVVIGGEQAAGSTNTMVAWLGAEGAEDRMARWSLDGTCYR